MKKILASFLLILLLNSCASIFNDSTYTFKVFSDSNTNRVSINDSIYKLPATLPVIRSKEDLKLTLITDSTEVDFVVESRLNNQFLLQNLLGLHIAPLNYAIDLTSQKRYHYGEYVFLNVEDSTRVFQPKLKKKWNKFFAQKFPKNKNDINLTFSIPYFNSFNYSPTDFGRRRSYGFWGLSVGIDYFYSDKKYVNLRAVLATNIFVPVPAPFTPSDIRQDLSTYYLEFTDNFKWGRLNLGYGVNFSKNNWRFVNESDFTNVTRINRNSNSFGLTANSYFELAEGLFIGGFYRPTFYRIHPNANFTYEHLISLDFLFKIPIRKKMQFKI